jgi:hypothetical protein
MPGVVKVGKSSKDPFIRAKELDSSAHPEAFIVEYDALVSDYHVAERFAHEELASYRVSGSGQGTEFFRCPVDAAVLAIRSRLNQLIVRDFFHRAQRKKIEQIERMRQLNERRRILRDEKLEKIRQKNEAELIAQRERAQRELEAEQRRRMEAEEAAQRRKWQEEQYKRTQEARALKVSIWLKDQEQRLAKEAKGLVLQNTMRLIKDGTLVVCSSCDSINYSGSRCVKCGQELVGLFNL